MVDFEALVGWEGRKEGSGFVFGVGKEGSGEEVQKTLKRSHRQRERQRVCVRARVCLSCLSGL